MMQLFQTEWCPSSHRVRQRMTELGIDFIARQVPVARAGRQRLIAASGSDVIPALLLGDGSSIVGEDAIEAYLDEHFGEPVGAESQRVKAEAMRRLELHAELSALHPSVLSDQEVLR